MIPAAVFVAAVAQPNKLPLSSKFSRIPRSMQKTYTHLLSISGKYMAGFLVKSFEGCCGSTVLTGASHAGCQVTAFLLRRLCPCRRSWITTVHRWSWTPTMVCAVTTPLHSLYQCSPNYGPRRKSYLWNHFTSPQTHFVENEKIMYLRKMCWFGRM